MKQINLMHVSIHIIIINHELFIQVFKFKTKQNTML